MLVTYLSSIEESSPRMFLEDNLILLDVSINSSEKMRLFDVTGLLKVLFIPKLVW